MRIATLKDGLRGLNRDVYIIGTGPSMRVTSLGWLKGKFTIGLNQAWRYFLGQDFDLDYSITVHPELLDEYLHERRRASSMRWLVRCRGRQYDDPDHYVFDARDNVSVLKNNPADTLFIGRGVQCAAMHLAAIMGARSIHLIGVDMASLGGDHHGHEQHVQFYGLSPRAVYKEYRHWTSLVRDQLWRLYGIPVFSSSPLLGAEGAQDEYTQLVSKRGLKPLRVASDITSQRRTKPDLPEVA